MMAVDLAVCRGNQGRIGTGIHPGVSADIYHADCCERPSLTRTIAHLLCTSSPLHAWTKHPRLNPHYTPEEAEKFDIGTVAHELLLAGGAAKLVVVDAADWRTNAAREQRDIARAAGNIPLLQKHWESVMAMREALIGQLAGHSASPPPFTDGKPEQTLVWEEPGGVVCRARPDWLRDDLAAVDDYKTTSRTANPEQWSRSLFGSGYDLQAAFYLRGLRVLADTSDVQWRFVVQETYPPYALSVVSLGEDVLTLARKKVEYAIDLWRSCLATDKWPAYPTRVCWATLPSFEEARWWERESREEMAT